MTYSIRFGLLSFVWFAAFASSVSAQPKLEEMADQPALFLETARKMLKWDEPAEPAKIVGNIYFVGTKGLSVFLITGSEGHIVLNTGMPGSGPMIEKSIRQLGFKPEDVKILLTGHAHCDHVGGHTSLKKLTGAKIAMIREEVDLFESGGKLDFHYGAIKEFGFDPAKVDTIFRDGDEIKLGNIVIKAILTAGHTRGSMTYTMNVVDNGTEYSVLFPNGTSINPGYRVVNRPSYPGIADDFLKTVETLESMKPDIWLMPHNEAYGYFAKQAKAATEGAKAWVDPDGYQKWIASVREKMETAIARESKQ